MTDQQYIGVDIGGTTSAVSLAGSGGEIRNRAALTTGKGGGKWQRTVAELIQLIREISAPNDITAIGVSCGGPLDRHRGVILSPPNLPGWDQIPIVELLGQEFPVPVRLENDANAGALAEWRYGAAQGCHNVIFLTFGTGLGAGLILDGELYTGTNDLAGEAGDIRLADDGPVGYHKRGSFEGFCSGSGFARQMGFELLCLQEEIGHEQMLSRYKEPGRVTGRDVVDWALNGDELAGKVIQKSAERLGAGLAILIDLLNPEMIVVGGMGVRLGDHLLGPARQVIRREAIPAAAKACSIVPAALGEQIGDYAALCVAQEAHNKSTGQEDLG